MFVPPPPIGRCIGMPPQDVSTPQGHAAVATDDAAVVVVHGHNYSPPVVVSPAVTGHDKERRRRRRKHELDDDAAGSAGVVVAAALSSGTDDGGDRARHHRPQRTPASENDDEGEDGSWRGLVQVQLSESAPATARPAVVLVGSRRKHRAAAGTYSTAGGGDSYYASDDHFAASTRPHSKPAKPHEAHYSAASASAAAAVDGVPTRVSNGGYERYDSPSVAARPNGLVNGGMHRHRQAANHADDYAAASISSSRLVIRVAHRRPPKLHKDHGAPSSSAPALPTAPEPSEDELLRVGLEVASRMDMDTLHSMVKEYVVGRNQQEAEAVEEERPPFWRPLTDDEADADLRAVYDMVAARRAPASGSGKRRRH